MTQDQIINILISLAGLFTAVKFKDTGRAIMEQQKKFNRFIGSPEQEKSFEGSAIAVTQIAALIFGLFCFIYGLVNIFV